MTESQRDTEREIAIEVQARNRAKRKRKENKRKTKKRREENLKKEICLRQDQAESLAKMVDLSGAMHKPVGRLNIIISCLQEARCALADGLYGSAFTLLVSSLQALSGVIYEVFEEVAPRPPWRSSNEERPATTREIRELLDAVSALSDDRSTGQSAQPAESEPKVEDEAKGKITVHTAGEKK